MKTLGHFSKLIIITLIIVMNLQAQIPNPGFEDWTGGDPDGWLTTNFPPILVNVTQSNNSHSGNWAVKGEVVDFMFPIPPYLNTGSQTSPGFPVDQKINRVGGYYQFNPVGGDHLLITAFIGITTPGDTTIIGSGAIAIGNTVSTYTQFSLDINYISEESPNWGNITITIIDTSESTSGHIGSTMLIDDLDIIVGVEDSEDNIIVEEFTLEQNYPNPFNPITKIKYQIPELSFVSIKVYDVLGNEITTLVNEERPAGTYELTWNATNLPSGVYFYRLQAGFFVETKKMVLLR